MVFLTSTAYNCQALGEQGHFYEDGVRAAFTTTPDEDKYITCIPDASIMVVSTMQDLGDGKWKWENDEIPADADLWV